MNAEGSIVWIVDKRSGQVGASLNLENGSFSGETIPPAYQKEGMKLFGVPIYNSVILKEDS